MHAINLLAWEFFTTPANIGAAEAYLREARGIDVGALCASQGGEPIVGYASTGWRALTRHLLGQGVIGSELLQLDLAQPSRSGELIDTYRGRLIIPVLGDVERMNGFIGRDTTGDARAPKNRNPKRTPVFDKSTALYRPTHRGLNRDANVVVVDGAIDALAIAAAAARTDQLPMFAPGTTSGVTVSGMQAHAVLALHPKPPIIALDGDRAGREGTDRWLRALCIERGRPVLVTRLPDGVDPAEWLQHQGDLGLRAFDRRGCLNLNTDVTADAPRPALPGRELVRIWVDQPGERADHVLDVLVPLAVRLPQGAARPAHRPSRTRDDRSRMEPTWRVRARRTLRNVTEYVSTAAVRAQTFTEGRKSTMKLRNSATIHGAGPREVAGHDNIKARGNGRKARFPGQIRGKRDRLI